MTISRRRLALGAISAAACVLPSGGAFANHTPRGQITLTATGANGDTVKATGTPSSGAFCSLPINEARASTGTGRVTVTVAPSSCNGSATSQLAAGTATVVLQYDNISGKEGWARPGPGFPWALVAQNYCDGPNKPATYTLGTFTISSGSASKGFTIPSTMNVTINGATRAHHICVKDSTGLSGAFAPFRIV